MTFNQIKDRLFFHINDVYEVFKDFFGEPYVDLQCPVSDSLLWAFLRRELGLPDTFDVAGDIQVSDWAMTHLLDCNPVHTAYIYIWWPEVTVANELDKSVKIQDLYARIEVSRAGLMPNSIFGLNRATYDLRQWNANYMHSHIRGIPKHDFTAFQTPCLGTGPIRGTIHSLLTTFDTVLWMQFCNELALYVTVESLVGVPYHKLEFMSTNNTNQYCDSNEFRLPAYRCATLYQVMGHNFLHSFMQYYLRNGHLRFCFHDGNFSAGMPYYDFMIDISNAFISYYNEQAAEIFGSTALLYSKSIVRRYVVINRQLYSVGKSSSLPPDVCQNAHVLTFKGRDIRLTITGTDRPDTDDDTVTILDPEIAMYILDNILKVINYHYRNEHNENSTAADSAGTRKRIIYL